jgi:hypothetical protein
MGIKRRKGVNQKGKKPILINDLKIIIDVINQQKIEDIKKYIGSIFPFKPVIIFIFKLLTL